MNGLRLDERTSTLLKKLGLAFFAAAAGAEKARAKATAGSIARGPNRLNNPQTIIRMESQ